MNNFNFDMTNILEAKINNRRLVDNVRVSDFSPIASHLIESY